MTLYLVIEELWFKPTLDKAILAYNHALAAKGLMMSARGNLWHNHRGVRYRLSRGTSVNYGDRYVRRARPCS